MSEGLSGTLTKDVGGIPVWAIGTGLAAVVVVGSYFMNKGDASALHQTVYDPTADPMQPDSSDPTNSDYGLPEGPLGDWLRENPGYSGYPVGQNVRGLPAPITNSQWARIAQDYLLAQGSDPSLVGSAFSKWLGRLTRTAAEQAVIDMAKRYFGAPPEGDSITTPPATAPPAPPPASKPVATGYRGWGWVQADGRTSGAEYAARYGLAVPLFQAFNPTAGRVPRAGMWLKLRTNSNPLVGYAGK